MDYFIADLHFGHKSVLSYDNRPFRNIEEHDEALIRNWNSVVKDTDNVYIHGDVSWHNAEKTAEILKKLKGKKHLIIGNHDHKLLKSKLVREQFASICPYKELYIDKELYVLSHYPIPCFNKHYYGAFHFYGHVHNSFEWNMMEHIRYDMENLYDKPCNMINIGCMMSYINYTPRTAEEIKKGYELFKKEKEPEYER